MSCISSYEFDVFTEEERAAILEDECGKLSLSETEGIICVSLWVVIDPAEAAEGRIVPAIPAWSEWSTVPAQPSATLEAEERMLYHARTRTVEDDTTFTEWTEWGDDPVQPTDNLSVEERTLYRIRTLE